MKNIPWIDALPELPDNIIGEFFGGNVYFLTNDDSQPCHLSSGTNAMAKYMMNNLIIPQNEGIGKGILAQVPWHKHGESKFLLSFWGAVVAVPCVLNPFFQQAGWI